MRKFSFHAKNFELHTSEKELKDLFIAWLMVSFAFAIVRLSATTTIPGISSFLSMHFLTLIIIAAITVGLGFLLHELAHKVVAQHYHCWAEFRADVVMLTLAIFMSFLGFVFIAPGAVMIYGTITHAQNGRISLAGPLTNVILALLLVPFLFINITSTLWLEVVHSGFLVNAWLALFNMIPFWNFDGAKIYRWNKIWYFTIVIVSAFLLFLFFVRTMNTL